MKKSIIRGLATLLLGTASYFAITNYTGQDITLEDGTVIESVDLKTHVSKVYKDKPSIDTLYVFLHHTVTNRDATIEDINRIHLQNGWAKLSYNFLVWHNSDIAYVNSIEKLTWHTKGSNTKGIAIALVGNYEEYYPTKEMEDAVRWLINDVICKVPNLYIKAIVAHKDAGGTPTLCPGKYAYYTFEDLFYGATKQ